MLSQVMVDAHANRVISSVKYFESQIVSEVDLIVADISARVVKELSHTRGGSRRIRNDAMAVMSVERTFESLLNASNYYPLVLALVADFSNQIDEFSTFYGEMSRNLPLPSAPPFGDAVAVLSDQSAAAVVALGGCAEQTKLRLRQFLSRSLNGSDEASFIGGVSAIVRKTSDVGTVARDQVMLFFRLIGSLVYSQIESFGKTLRYSYAGLGGRKHREFCALRSKGAPCTMNEIGEMDNGQVPNVLTNGGGWGCMHWWAIEGVAE